MLRITIANPSLAYPDDKNPKERNWIDILSTRQVPTLVGDPLAEGLMEHGRGFRFVAATSSSQISKLIPDATIEFLLADGVRLEFECDSQSQSRALQEIGKALVDLGERFDVLADKLSEV